jgi:hypothetical protein
MLFRSTKAMAFSNDPRCPQCQAPVPLVDLWRRAPKDRGGIFLIGKIGIACPMCATKLRVHQTGLVVASVGSFAVFCAAFGVLGAVEHARLGAARQDLNLLLIAPAIVGWMLLFRRYGYRFARLRGIEHGERVVFPLSKPAVEAKSTGERPRAEAVASSRPSPVAPEPATGADVQKEPWICAECGEENPAQFDICCICETRRGCA